MFCHYEFSRNTLSSVANNGGNMQVRWLAGGVFVLLSLLPIGSLAQTRAPWKPISELGGAKLLNARDIFVYPPDAVRQNAQGQVVMSFDITVEGRVENCMVTQSSGHKSLDRPVCPLMERRARFDPARGGDGLPIATEARMSMEFWFPKR